MTTGICPGCDQTIRVKKNGLLYKHRAYFDPVCEGSDAHPRRLPPTDPFYCDTCYWGDCHDCVDSNCDCYHWCPTELEMADLIRICHVCKNPHQIGFNGRFVSHKLRLDGWQDCEGSYKAYRK